MGLTKSALLGKCEKTVTVMMGIVSKVIFKSDVNIHPAHSPSLLLCILGTTPCRLMGYLLLRDVL